MTESLMKEPFRLQHVALYAKGWYKRTDDLYKDLGLMLEKDGYPGYEGDRYGIMSIILRAWQEWAEWYNGLIPEGWRKKDLDHLVTTDAKNVYRRYRAGSSHEKWNLTDFYDVIIMAILIEWSQSETKYINLRCPDYTEELLPNDAGLFSQHEWYEQAEKIGIKTQKALVRFFNKKVTRLWKKWEK